MTIDWLIFIVVLFVLEPLFLHGWFQEQAMRDSDGAFRLLHAMHVILMAISLVAICGAVADVRGFVF